MKIYGGYEPLRICRHVAGDPACGAGERRAAAYDSREKEQKLKDAQVKISVLEQRLAEELKAQSPDSSAYRIQEVMRIGPHLVMKVLYPNCKRCSFEGSKVMVFLNATESAALRWRVIDPHFREPSVAQFPPPPDPTLAPSPDARFPASDAGWKDAIAYAEAHAPRNLE